jgi:proteic killer suppression protein
MIRSFGSRTTQRLFDDDVCPAQWRAFKSVAVRKLDMIDAATKVEDLLTPPGNRLEGLKGDRKGQWSIRINQQWRICFRWTSDGPADVEIVDYH